MRFWDRQVTRFYAMGIEIDPHDLDVLENGGEVVHLHHLLSPEWAGGYRYEKARDQNDEPVMVPEILQVPPLNEIYSLDWGNHGGHSKTIWQYLESEFEEEWRKYPSYPGVVDEQHNIEDRTLGARLMHLQFYRFWNCNTFPDREVIEEMVDAANRRLDNSRYYQVAQVFDWEAENAGMSVDTLWAFQHDQDRLTKRDWESVESFLNTSDITNQESIDIAVEAYEIAMREGYLCPLHPTDEEFDSLRPIHYPPMSEFLPPQLNQMWEGMLARQQYIVFRVTEFMDPSERYRFDKDEESE